MVGQGSKIDVISCCIARNDHPGFGPQHFGDGRNSNRFAPLNSNQLCFERTAPHQLANSGFNPLKITQNQFRRMNASRFPIVSAFKKIKNLFIFFFETCENMVRIKGISMFEMNRSGASPD